MNVTRDNTTAVIERLPGFTEYYFSVRSRLEDRFSLAVVAVRRRTISRGNVSPTLSHFPISLNL